MKRDEWTDRSFLCLGPPRMSMFDDWLVCLNGDDDQQVVTNLFIGSWLLIALSSLVNSSSSWNRHHKQKQQHLFILSLTDCVLLVFLWS